MVVVVENVPNENRKKMIEDIFSKFINNESVTYAIVNVLAFLTAFLVGTFLDRIINERS